MKHYKADIYKHDSQRQRHDRVFCSLATSGGPQVERHCCETTSPIMPLPLGVMLVTVNLAMPHGTCSLATAGGPQFDTHALRPL
ncbi:unnamed protein product, partial [Staurois parvus]